MSNGKTSVELLEDCIAAKIPQGMARLEIVNGLAATYGAELPKYVMHTSGLVRYQEGEATEFTWPAELGDHMRRTFFPKWLRRRVGVRYKVMRIVPRRVYRDNGYWTGKVVHYMYTPAATPRFDVGVNDKPLYGDRSEIVVKSERRYAATLVAQGLLEHIADATKLSLSQSGKPEDHARRKAAAKTLDIAADAIAKRWEEMVHADSVEIESSWPATWWDALKVRYAWLGKPKMTTVKYGREEAARACGQAVAIPHVYQWEVKLTKERIYD